MLPAVPALVLRHALQRADGSVVALVYAVYLLPVAAENVEEHREERVLYALNADGERLRDEDI